MKRSNNSFLLAILVSLVLLFATGCDKINFEFFNASEEEETQSVEASDDNQDNTDTTISDDKATTQDEAQSSASDDTQESAQDSNKGSNKETVTPTSSPVQPNANVDLPLYTVNADSGEIEAVTASIMKGTEITPQLIVDTVVESLADQSIEIKVKDVTTKDDAIIVDFDKNKTPSKNMGSGYEGAILDAIAQSLMDNLEDYNKVIYRIDGEAYVSGAFEYGIDEAHFER